LCTGGGLLLPPPPHPSSETSRRQSMAIREENFPRKRGRIIEKSGSHAAKKSRPELDFEAADGATVPTATVKEAAVVPGVTLAGVTEHVLNIGAPEQESAIAFTNVPATGATLKA
jgi:hypothetical protein